MLDRIKQSCTFASSNVGNVGKMKENIPNQQKRFSTL